MRRLSREAGIDHSPRLSYWIGGVALMDANKMQLFQDKRICTAWDEEVEEWYFSVVDVVSVLTD